MLFELPDTPKPGIDQLLIECALRPELRRRLLNSPEEVFPEFDLTEEQRDILRTRDGRLLELLGAALARQAGTAAGAVAPAADAPAPPAPQAAPPQPQGRQLPDLRFVLTVVPVAQEEAGKLRGLTFAAWMNPLPEGTDPETLPPPEGAVLPGQPLAPLRAVVHVCAQLLPGAGGSPQVGLTASLLQSSNVAAPARPGDGRPARRDRGRRRARHLDRRPGYGHRRPGDPRSGAGHPRVAGSALPGYRRGHPRVPGRIVPAGHVSLRRELFRGAPAGESATNEWRRGCSKPRSIIRRSRSPFTATR